MDRSKIKTAERAPQYISYRLFQQTLPQTALTLHKTFGPSAVFITDKQVTKSSLRIKLDFEVITLAKKINYLWACNLLLETYIVFHKLLSIFSHRYVLQILNVVLQERNQGFMLHQNSYTLFHLMPCGCKSIYKTF